MIKILDILICWVGKQTCLNCGAALKWCAQCKSYYCDACQANNHCR